MRRRCHAAGLRPSLSQALSLMLSPALPLKNGTQTRASNDYSHIPAPVQLASNLRAGTSPRARKTQNGGLSGRRFLCGEL
jgi:hypothetical protein